MKTLKAATATEGPAPPPMPPEDLAASLASKLCHDFISPANAIMSGLDLLDDPSAKDMRDDAMALIASSAHKLVDQLVFARAAYGAPAGVETFDCAELEGLAQGVYAHVRAQLDWAAPAGPVSKTAAQVLLNFAQLAANALPLGGTARIETDFGPAGRRIEAMAVGPKARLHAEVATGLAGEPLQDGLSGRWAPAYFVQALARAAGGALTAETAEERVTFRAMLPE